MLDKEAKKPVLICEGNLLSLPPSRLTASMKRSWSSGVHLMRGLEALWLAVEGAGLAAFSWWIDSWGWIGCATGGGWTGAGWAAYNKEYSFFINPPKGHVPLLFICFTKCQFANGVYHSKNRTTCFFRLRIYLCRNCRKKSNQIELY